MNPIQLVLYTLLTLFVIAMVGATINTVLQKKEAKNKLRKVNETVSGHYMDNKEFVPTDFINVIHKK